jgi:lipopolysaccharide heptosyltransferase II
VRKFLLINPFGIGDILFTAPLISALKGNFPGSLIGYWCNARTAELLECLPAVDKIFALSRGDLKKIFRRSAAEGWQALRQVFRQIRKEKFETAFDFSLDQRYGMFCWLAGIKRRIGFDYKGRGSFLTDKVSIEGYSQRPVAEYYLDLLSFLGGELRSRIGNSADAGPGAGLSLTVPAAAKTRTQQLLAGYGVGAQDILLGIAPGGGASWGRDASRKYWPAENFAQTAGLIPHDGRMRVVLLGDESEVALCDKLACLMPCPCLNLAGKLTLPQLVALISRLRLLFCNDAGPLHIAVALGIPTVSLFGPVDEKVYGPYPASERHTVMKKDLACRPCYKNFRLAECGRDKECLKGISAEEASSAIRRMLL